jgi:hypothetical protein
MLLVVAIFLGGAACGAAIATLAVTRHIHGGMQDPHSIASHITARFGKMLDLTDQQVDQVQRIIMRRHDALIDIRREIQPRLEAELSILEEEIAGVLNEEQRAKWHAHAAMVRAQWLPPIPEAPAE